MFFFFFNDPATTEIYTLSLHDALPICPSLAPGSTRACASCCRLAGAPPRTCPRRGASGDRKSTRLNSSHDQISYAVFFLEKKKKKRLYTDMTNHDSTESGAHYRCHMRS